MALSETVPALDGCRTVPPGGGAIRVGWLDYHHADFGDARVAGQRIPVRRCSSDVSFVYVQLSHRHPPGWERARLVTGGIDQSVRSWRQARALIEERARQHYIASIPASQDANALVLSDLLLSIDDYERERLDKRRAIDEEQSAAADIHGGLEASPELEPVPVEFPTRESGGSSIAPPIDVENLRSYDE